MSHRPDFGRWRELLAERVEEAIAEIGSVEGVSGLVVGGSVGRGEAWPMSDIDIIPIFGSGCDPTEGIRAAQGRLETWWAGSGRAQEVDVGKLYFSIDELDELTQRNAELVASRMSDPRWFHGLDKSFGGYAAADPDGVAGAFSAGMNTLRFHQAVVTARLEQWWVQARAAQGRAKAALSDGEFLDATLALREAARSTRQILIESWGERLGSMGREWTRFERMAAIHKGEDKAKLIAKIADASADDALSRMNSAPEWLRERVRLSLAARRVVAEDVSEEQNARDNIAAFSVQVPKYRPKPWGDWIHLPDHGLESKLAMLEELLVSLT